MIKDYHVIKHADANTLVQIVKEYITKGWEPIGGVAIMLCKVSGNTVVAFDNPAGEISLIHAQAVIYKEIEFGKYPG